MYLSGKCAQLQSYGGATGGGMNNTYFSFVV